jgi:hypothetical protein
MIEGNGGRLDSFEERILSYLRENRGTSFTAFQVANFTGTAGAGLLLGKSSGYAVGVQLVLNALENLVCEGHVVKQVRKEGIVEDTYYYAK